MQIKCAVISGWAIMCLLGLSPRPSGRIGGLCSNAHGGKCHPSMIARNVLRERISAN